MVQHLLCVLGKVLEGAKAAQATGKEQSWRAITLENVRAMGNL